MVAANLFDTTISLSSTEILWFLFFPCKIGVASNIKYNSVHILIFKDYPP
jgi:hypothetical protein